MPLRLVVLASGRGSNLAALQDRIEEGLVDGRIELVVSDRPEAPCLDLAGRRGLAASCVAPAEGQDHDGRLAAAVEAARPELVVLAGFMRILGPRALASCPHIVNVHPSLLPAYRGAHGVRDAMRGGARVTGCTTHLVTPELDAGPILLQAALAVRQRDTEATLRARVQALEHQVLPRTVQLFAEGRVQVEGGRVRIAPGASWTGRLPRIPDALYPDGF